MTIAVTGASGGVGSRVVQNLVADAGAASAVALARRPEAVRSGAQLAVRRVDYDEPGSLRAALAAVAVLVFISSDGVAESMRRHHEHVLTAASNAGVQHVVYTSILDVAPESRFYYAGVHRATETLLARSGIAHCVARTSIFADYFVSAWLEPALEAGRARAAGRLGRHVARYTQRRGARAGEGGDHTPGSSRSPAQKHCEPMRSAARLRPRPVGGCAICRSRSRNTGDGLPARGRRPG
jgi:uncharacterized protein YbjT (DUF2867 family)